MYRHSQPGEPTEAPGKEGSQNEDTVQAADQDINSKGGKLQEGWTSDRADSEQADAIPTGQRQACSFASNVQRLSGWPGGEGCSYGLRVAQIQTD